MAVARAPRAAQSVAASAPPTDHRTELDGIRLKVFTDRYSLKDREGNPTEDSMMTRNRAANTGICALRPPMSAKSLE